MAMRRRFLWGIGSCAAGAAGAAALPGEGLSDDPLERVKVRASAARRGARAFAVFGSAAIDYKWSLHGMDRKTDDYKLALAACHTRAADRLLFLCSTQAGVYIKAGQLLASTRPFIPSEFSSKLSQLHDNAPQSPLADVEKVFHQDMGLEIERTFEWFDPAPHGCASLAQVHRAGLKTESGGVEIVAVKVQHAWMSQHTASDLTAMKWVARAIELSFPGVEVQWLLPVFRASLSKELDFRLEHQNAKRCASNFNEDATVYVPKNVDRLCSRRILTMEFIDGVKVDEIQRLQDKGFDPRAVAHMVTRVFGEMVFHHGFVHCDPHPGNMLVRWAPSKSKSATTTIEEASEHKDSGSGFPQLVILDHGLYREIDEGVRVNYCRLWLAMILQDKGLLSTVATELGVGEYASLLPLVFINRALTSHTRLGTQLSKEERKRIKMEVLPENLRRETFDMGAAIDFIESLPRDLLFIMRTQTIVRALCSDLGYLSRDRFRMYARLAAANARSSSGLGRLRKWLRGVRLETRLILLEFFMWVSPYMPSFAGFGASFSAAPILASE